MDRIVALCDKWLVEDWRTFRRWWSARSAIAMGALTLLWHALPSVLPQIVPYLPASTPWWAILIALLVVMLAAVLKQPGLK